MKWVFWLIMLVMLSLLIVSIVFFCKNENFSNSEGLEDMKTSLVIPTIKEDISKLDNLFQSIQKQSIQPTEIIIALSEVTNTEADEVEKHLQTLTDVPTKVLGISEKAYAGINRNRGAEKSIGDYILFMDADDIMHPEYIETILYTFNKYDPIGIVHGYTKDVSDLPKTIKNIKIVNNGTKLYKLHKNNPPTNNLRNGLPHGNLHHGHLSVKKKVFQDGLKYTNRRRGQDSEFIRKLLDHYEYLGDKNINHIDSKISVYNKRHPIKNYQNTLKTILEDSYVLTLDTHDLDYNKANLLDKRLAELEDTFLHYELPYRIAYGLYYDGTDSKRSMEDIDTIHKNYPFIQTEKLKQNGEIGLIGSFFKLLYTAEPLIENFLTIYEDDAKPVGPKEEFWEKFNKALDNMPKKDDKKHPGVYILGYTNYCKKSCPNSDKWTRSYNKKTNGSHAIIFSRKAIENILNNVKNNKVNLPLDRYLKKLDFKDVINVYVWEGESSNKGMFCGLFSQSDTYCDTRNSLIEH